MVQMSSNTSVVLSADNELQIQSFLRFAKLKREQHIKEVISAVDDFQEGNVRHGEMYSTRDVEELFADLKAEIMAYVEKEVSNAYHTNGLLVKLLLGQAQINGLDLFVDTNQLENEFLLKQIKASEDSALTRPASDFVRRNTQLDKIGSVATVSVKDPVLVKECDELKDALAQLQQQFNTLQVQTTTVMREKSSLTMEVTALKDRLSQWERDWESAQVKHKVDLQAIQAKNSSTGSMMSGEQVPNEAISLLHSHLEQSNMKVERLESELSSVRQDLQNKAAEVRQLEQVVGAKLQESKQWQQMKKLMQQKSQEVVLLRKKLSQYEPNEVSDGDTIGTAVVDE